MEAARCGYGQGPHGWPNRGSLGDERDLIFPNRGHAPWVRSKINWLRVRCLMKWCILTTVRPQRAGAVSSSKAETTRSLSRLSHGSLSGNEF